MIPPIEQWLAISEAAKKLGIKASQLHNARTRGRVTKSGRVVVLKCWKTLKGYITTVEAIQDFHRELNE